MLTGNVFITGGTGTLGHAISMVAASQSWPCQITVYSRNDERQARMRRHFPGHRYIAGDIRDTDRLATAMVGHDTVVHAAALKRVPEAETQPDYYISVNVDGSRSVIQAAKRANVSLVLGVSTDKACNPVTVYGTTKALMESLFREQDPTGDTVFLLVRYGNVVASSGSVLQLWHRQNQAREKLTLTHSLMTRFWASPFQAVSFLAKTATIPRGCTLVPKMGGAHLMDLAKTLYPNAALAEIGLRSIEKVHESLVAEHEPVIAHTETELVLSRTYAEGETGHSFTSYQAKPITADSVREMVEEAREVESLMK